MHAKKMFAMVCAACALFQVACGSKDEAQDTTVQDLQGTWSRCDVGQDESSKFSIEFSGASATLRTAQLHSADCAGDFWLEGMIDTEVVLGEGVAGVAGATEIDHTITAIEIHFSADFVGELNALPLDQIQQMFPFIEAKPVVSSYSLDELDVDEHFEVGQTVYDIVKVDGDALYLGDSEGMVTVESQRATTLNMENAYSRD